MSGEAGPAPGARTLAGTDPRPAATVSLRTRGWNEGEGVGCPVTGYPDRKDVPQRHTDKAPALSRTPRQRGETNGGDDGEVANDQARIPRARVPVGLVHHPAGTSRATGQAEASSHGDAAAGPAPGQSSVILGPDPRTEDRRRLARETHAAGKNVERGAGRSHINYLDRLLLAPRPILGFNPRASMIIPGGSNPDRRRSLGFLTICFPLSPLWERLQNRGLSPIRAKPQILLVRGSVPLPRHNRPPHLRFLMFRRLALA